jgi:hypothetical protein
MQHHDTLQYKAFRIVIQNFIIESNRNRRISSANKIIKWWYRISGCFHHYKLIKSNYVDMQAFPPGLWRERKYCRNKVKKNNMYCKEYCRIKLNRWNRRFMLNQIKTYKMRKRILSLNKKGLSENWDQYSNDVVDDYLEGWHHERCLCNIMPAYIIINFKLRFGSMKHIYKIMSMDNISVITRARVSRFIQSRLS